MIEYLYVNNDNLVKNSSPLANADGDIIETASPVFTVYTLDNEEVAGQSFPSFMTHEGGGYYSGTLSASLELVEGDWYKIVITADTVYGKAEQTLELQARTR